MKIVFTTVIILFLAISSSIGQVFQVDTLQYKGDINKYINFVIIGDGYTSEQQNNFITEANNLSRYLLTQTPWINYSNYFNIFAIKVVSSQSGTKHPNTASDCDTASPLVPVSNPTTYLGCTFDVYGIHRLVVPQNISNLAGVLAKNFPNYDQVFVIANSPYYGGSGGGTATSTTDLKSPEVSVHELGHSFAKLADEYYAGDNFASEKPNMTQQTNTTLVKWTNWIGYNGTGIYQHSGGGQSASWYRPHNNCKMRYLGAQFCNVCAEAIIERIHSLVNVIVGYTPTTLTITSPKQYLGFKLSTLMKPVPNTLNIVWNLDGKPTSKNVDSIQVDQNTLSIGTHTLTATVIDTSAMLRVNNHPTIHFSTVNWTIAKLTTGIELKSSTNKISCSVYPNPTTNFFTFEFELDKKSKVSIQLISLDGRIIQQIENKTIESGQYSNTLSIENLSVGTYSLVFKIDNTMFTQTIIKQ
jgi:hypothetical protein